MRFVSKVLFTMATIVLALPASAAQEVSVSDLIENGQEFADEEVVVSGELVGDYGFRSDGWMWTQLNSDAYSSNPLRESGSPEGGNVGIGVRMPADMATGLDSPGGYRQRGPLVTMTGVWRYHDEARQGESYFEAAALIVVKDGRQLTQDPTWLTILVGAGLILISAVLWRKGSRRSWSL
ncbi:MAG: hypothetical protein WEB67_10730 [Acidimicrobiia bacterium]